MGTKECIKEEVWKAVMQDGLSQFGNMVLPIQM